MTDIDSAQANSGMDAFEFACGHSVNWAVEVLIPIRFMTTRSLRAFDLPIEDRVKRSASQAVPNNSHLSD